MKIIKKKCKILIVTLLICVMSLGMSSSVYATIYDGDIPTSGFCKPQYLGNANCNSCFSTRASLYGCQWCRDTLYEHHYWVVCNNCGNIQD